MFVCLICGLAFKLTAIVISGRCLHFMGLLSNIRSCQPKYAWKYYYSIKQLCMDGLTVTNISGQAQTSGRLTSIIAEIPVSHDINSHIHVLIKRKPFINKAILVRTCC